MVRPGNGSFIAGLAVQRSCSRTRRTGCVSARCARSSSLTRARERLRKATSMSAPARPRLLVVFYANPDHYPPTFNAVTLLSEHFDVHVVCRKSDRETRLWPAGVRLTRVGPSRTHAESMAVSKAEKLREFLAFVWAVRRALSEQQPAIVLAYEQHAFTAASLAGCRAPLVYQRHEVEELDAFDRRSLGGWIGSYALRKSDDAALLVFPEAHRAAYYQRFVKLRREPMIVPNFPLRSSFPEPDFALRLPERARARHVLYRGAIGPQNGLREAISAMPHLDAAITLRLCGASDPAFGHELFQLAITEGVRDRVDLTGFVQFDELNRQTQRASVGLMLYQPIGTNWTFIATANNKLFEYAACGVPALAPDRLAFQELLGGEAFVELVDETDPKAIAAAVQRILSSPEAYETRCRLARRRFEEQFNYERVFQPMLARMRELAAHQ